MIVDANVRATDAGGDCGYEIWGFDEFDEDLGAKHASRRRKKKNNYPKKSNLII